MSAKLPALVERYLYETLVQAVAPLVLGFSREWKLNSAMGDATRFGLDLSGQGRGIDELRDLFLGMDLGEAQTFEFVQLSGGRHCHLHLLPEGDGFYLIVVDVSAETARQQVVQQAGNEAALASHERGRALKKLKRIRAELEAQTSALSEGNALKTALITTLSHEFRTPLTAIFGYLHLLEKRLSETPDSLHSLRAIRRAATHLFALSENLLEYGRGEGGHSLVEARPVALSALSDDLREMFAPIAAEQNLQFGLKLEQAAGDPPDSDALKLRQILINLIGNALRYTPNGQVDALISWDGMELLLQVKDSGLGIPEAALPTIFTPFQRGPNISRRGAGLGLSIVKQLVDQLGGRIEVTSRVGEGSMFRVRLPKLAASGAVKALPETRASALRALPGSAALVVDDEPDVRQLIAIMLRQAGFEVDSAATVDDAMAKIAKLQPSLIAMDVQLPGLSGNAGVYKLRAQGYKGRILTLSATATRDARDAALSAGADAYLTKPIDPEALLRAALPQN